MQAPPPPCQEARPRRPTPDGKAQGEHGPAHHAHAAVGPLLDVEALSNGRVQLRACGSARRAAAQSADLLLPAVRNQAKPSKPSAQPGTASDRGCWQPPWLRLQRVAQQGGRVRRPAGPAPAAGTHPKKCHTGSFRLSHCPSWRGQRCPAAAATAAHMDCALAPGVRLFAAFAAAAAAGAFPPSGPARRPTLKYRKASRANAARLHTLSRGPKFSYTSPGSIQPALQHTQASGSSGPGQAAQARAGGRPWVGGWWGASTRSSTLNAVAAPVTICTPAAAMRRHSGPARGVCWLMRARHAVAAATPLTTRRQRR